MPPGPPGPPGQWGPPMGPMMGPGPPIDGRSMSPVIILILLFRCTQNILKVSISPTF